MEGTSTPPTRTLPLGAIVLGTVFTVVVAFGSVWPFVNGWLLRTTPSFLAGHAWMLESDTIGTLVGGHRYLESDWFPKGGDDGERARFQFKITGDLSKEDVVVLLEQHDGAWNVVSAGRKLPDDTWVDLVIE